MLDGKLSREILNLDSSPDITSQLTLSSAFSQTPKGVYQNTVVYTLVPETATYTVSFDSNGGSGVIAQSNIAKYSKVAIPASPTRAGY